MKTVIIDNPSVLEDEWRGLYKDSWSGAIVPEAFAHPAKYSRSLIRHIYQHVIHCGWIHPGEHVVDPFGGVALGGLDAMRHALNWTGCELEEKFHVLGNQNIALWNDRYSRMPQWGSARLLNGDSRKLVGVIREAQIAVSSPPYAASINQNDQANDHMARADRKAAAGVDMTRSHNRGGPNSVLNRDQKYGNDPAQLGTMKEGDLQCAISSPPYSSGEKGHPSLGSVNNDDWGKDGRDITRRRGKTGEYGETDGQIGSMREGDHSLAITSPPYNPPMSQDHNGSHGGSRGTTPSEKGAFVKYGNSDGQLEEMSMEGHALAISSPPYVAISPEKSSKSVDYTKQYETYRSQGGGAAFEKFVATQELHSGGYGNSVGQLSAMSGNGFAAAINSPPFESSTQVNNTAGDMTAGRARWEGGNDSAARVKQDYADYSAENMGNQRGEAFWSASRVILEQLHSVLSPEAHAVFVVKAFVRNKQIVDFPAQWAQLCEAVGFRLIHDHHALLTEEHGEQYRLGGGTDRKTVARKSFFRRLAESKGSPKIDYENVLCFVRLP